MVELSLRKPPFWLWRFALVLLLVGGSSLLLIAPALAEGADPASVVRPVMLRFEGTVETLEEHSLTVNTTAGVVLVALNDQTVINEDLGDLEVGAHVAMQGTRQGDGSVLARVIKVLNPSAERSRPIQLSGEIKALPTRGLVGEWTVGERTVVVSDGTQINPPDVAPELGDYASVTGVVLPDGKVQARSIFVRKAPGIEVNFIGAIERLSPDVWVVRGVTVLILPSTEITGATPEVGLIAEVAGRLLSNRSVAATRIRVRPRPDPAVKFVGTIVSKSAPELPAVWGIHPIAVVDALSPTDSARRIIMVTVTERTEIDQTKGPADIGALVEVKAIISPVSSTLDPRTLIATNIIVLRPPPGSVEITFTGPIQRLSEEIWVVQGIRVFISTTTEITGADPRVGLIADVTGIVRPEGGVNALKIFVHEPPTIKFVGTIVAKSHPQLPVFPQVWTIRAMVNADTLSATPSETRLISVTVTAETQIDETVGPADIGAVVEVKALVWPPTASSIANAELTATHIVVLRPAPTPEPITFTGPIQRLSDEVWVVRGIRVYVSDATEISGAEPRIGLIADVAGTQRPDMGVDARSIFVHEPPPEVIEFAGVILYIPPERIGTWKFLVGQREVKVEVTRETEIIGWPHIGSIADVTCVRRADGTLVAKRIRARGVPTES